MEAKIEELLGQLTVEEKVAMLAGASTWMTVLVERLGIPAIKVSDGPNGARGDVMSGGSVTSACFPVGIGLAASWDPALVEQIGRALGEETKTKGAHVLLAPTVNIHRSPLNGRNFECYSEDPYLSAKIGVAYIKGVQSQNVGATVKHYVCNDSEYQRNSISSEVRERALREIYLPPFKAAVDAGVWAVMASYNKVNGTFAGENRYTLVDILKQEWGFDGLVMSDWFGTKSTAAAAQNGLDLEMPGPPIWRGEKLLAAVRRGEVDQAAIDDSVRRLLRLIERVGAFEHPGVAPEQAIDRPEHRAIIRRAAAEGIVLLKNDGDVLPLSPDTVGSLAIIGPNAKTAQIMGGGSAHVNAHYAITPFDGIVGRAGDAIEIRYELGCTNYKALPLPNPAWLASGDGPGLKAEYFNSPNLMGDVVWSTTTRSTEMTWFGEFAPSVNPHEFSARLTGQLIAPEAGRYTFGLISAGLSRLYLDDQEVIDNWTSQKPGASFFGAGSAELTYVVDMQAGQSARIRLEYAKVGAGVPFAGLRLGCLPPIPADAMERAATLAAESDAALVFVGLSDEWESEGYDRPNLELAGDQVALIERIAAANKRTVVVLNTGSPISMSWLDKVAGVVQAWYPGQECGNAIADVLFGDVNPSGKLPETFPRRLEDNPAYINYPGELGAVYYGEGIFVGYRYYEKKRVQPLLPFGYGLSYTTFSYANLRLSASELRPDDQLEMEIDITNTGKRTGKEVVQLYVRDPQASVQRPEKELKGFAKVELAPGETKTIALTLDREALAYYDDVSHQWVAEAGAFEVLIGASSQDIRATAGFTLVASSRFGGRPRMAGAKLTIGSPLQALLADDRTREILDRHLPDIASSPMIGMASGMPLEQVAAFAPQIITAEALRRIAEDLA